MSTPKGEENDNNEGFITNLCTIYSLIDFPDIRSWSNFMENMDYSHKGSDDMSDRITINFFYYLSNYLCIIVGSLVCLCLFIPKLLYTFLIAIILMIIIMDVVIPYFTPQTLKPSPAFNLFLIVLFITAYRMGAMFHLLHYILLTFSLVIYHMCTRNISLKSAGYYTLTIVKVCVKAGVFGPPPSSSIDKRNIQ